MYFSASLAMKYIIGFGFLFFLCTLECNAQKLSKIEAEAEHQFNIGNYYAAADLYKKAWELDSFNIDRAWKVAESAWLLHNYQLAGTFYLKSFKADQGKKYPESAFYCGLCEFNQGSYKSAKKWFDKYARKFRKKKPTEANKADDYIKRCEFAMMLSAEKQPSSFRIFSDSINTNFAESGAIAYKNKVFYTGTISNGHNTFSRIFYCSEPPVKTKGKQLKFQNFDDTTNLANPFPDVLSGELFFTVIKTDKDKILNTLIYKGKLINDTLVTDIEALPEQINKQGFNNTQANISYIGNIRYLFFSSNRDGGIGKMDIWYSTQINGKWTEPVNAGQEVNSPEDEITPWFCGHCNLVFFSSNGHYGLGGFDIFSSHMKNSTFETPKNVGTAINTCSNDIYLRRGFNSKYLFVTSNRQGSHFEKFETCCNDLYFMTVNDSTDSFADSLLVSKKVSARISTSFDSVQTFKTSLKLLVPLTLYFNNDEPDPKTTRETTSINYSDACVAYLKQKPKYLKAYSQGLKNNEQEKAVSEMDDFFEDSVSTGLINLEKFTELLFLTLQKGENVTITLKGYCSPLASTNYNVSLAKRRIVSLKNYFYEWKNGALRPYINKELNYILEEIGELKAPLEVSDNPNDAANSVFSRRAALERKIEIIAIAFK